MLLKSITTSGITITGIQAPEVNLETTTMTSTRPVVKVPTTAMVKRTRHPGSRRRQSRRTMPDCDNVKLVKTPAA